MKDKRHTIGSDELSAYLDGQAERPEEVRAAIESDPSLARELEDFARISAHLRSLPETGPSPDFTQRVLSRIEQAPARKPSSIIFVLRWATPFAVAAGLLFVSSFSGDLSGESRDPSMTTATESAALPTLDDITSKLAAYIEEDPDAAEQLVLEASMSPYTVQASFGLLDHEFGESDDLLSEVAAYLETGMEGESVEGALSDQEINELQEILLATVEEESWT